MKKPQQLIKPSPYALPKVIVVAGPTASGKSDFAVKLAKELDGEIISCDSRQVYIGLDIGTGKITVSEMQGIPHHMLDVCDLKEGENQSVVTFKEKALPIMLDIINRNKTPILTGGTGQYIDALIFSNELPQVAPNKILRESLEKLTTNELSEKLKLLDENRLKNIDAYNRPRLIRAIEIAEILGKVPDLEPLILRYPTTMYILNPPRELLRQRIEKRLHLRLGSGMLDEGKKIFELNLTERIVRSLGIEYIAMNKYFNNEISLEEMKSLIIHKSAQYAKRQITWLKKYEKINNLELIEVKVDK